MKLLIAVPSHNRPYDIQKRCLFWLKEITLFDWKVFVEPSQMMYYSQVLTPDRLVSTIEGAGLNGQIRFIGRYAEENGYSHVFKVDDDMMFKRDGIKKDFIGKETERILVKCLDRMSFDRQIHCITFAKPMGYRYSTKSGFQLRKRPVYGNYLTLPVYLNQLNPDLKIMDDLFISIDIVLAWKTIETCNELYEDAISHKNAGGLQSVDRDLLGKKTFEAAKKLYPLVEEMENSKNGTFDINVNAYFQGLKK
jgi:hypothetical protein